MSLFARTRVLRVLRTRRGVDVSFPPAILLVRTTPPRWARYAYDVCII